MALPNDPIILLSYVNTKLRDDYSSFDEFCRGESADPEETAKKLLSVGYEYSPELNKFV